MAWTIRALPMCMCGARTPAVADPARGSVTARREVVRSRRRHMGVAGVRGCNCRVRCALRSSRGGWRTGLTASGLPARLILMLRSLLAYPRVSIPVAEGKRSGQCHGCRKVQKEARRERDSSMCNGLRHGYRRSGGITPVVMVDPDGFAAACKPWHKAGQARSVVCRKCAERFTFLATPRWLRELGEGVMRCRRALGRRVGASGLRRCRRQPHQSFLRCRGKMKTSEPGQI